VQDAKASAKDVVRNGQITQGAGSQHFKGKKRGGKEKHPFGDWFSSSQVRHTMETESRKDATSRTAGRRIEYRGSGEKKKIRPRCRGHGKRWDK